MQLLHVIPSTDPATGGPAEGLRRILKGYERLGCSAEVISNDAPESRHSVDIQSPVHHLGPGKGVYGYNTRLHSWLRENYARFDGIIAHGIWQYPALAVRQTVLGKRPYVVFTHGMLDPWFRDAYPLKHLKKYPYWLLALYPLLRDAKRVLFTSPLEQELAPKSFSPYKCHGEVIPYGTLPPEDDPPLSKQAFYELCPGVKGRPFLLFIARLHEKKGCDLLVQAFADVCKDQPDMDLVMAGPDSVGLKAKLQSLAMELGIAERIHWPGMLKGDAKWGAFRNCEAFILPSHQENFGIAVAEAMACARPVLITNKVNIWPDIVQSHSGLVEDDTLEGTRSLLHRFLQLDEAERTSMGKNGMAFFQAHYNSLETAAAIYRIFST
jgi:glycosyltransferase involved in cell wall biosynthesis